MMSTVSHYNHLSVNECPSLHFKAGKSGDETSVDDVQELSGEPSETEDVSKEMEWLSSPSKEANPANSKTFAEAVHHVNINIVVIVNFYDHRNSQAPPHEVWVKESSAVAVEFKSADEDTGIWTTQLSHLLPEVIKTDSPIKGQLIICSQQ
jgi:hypothetical protein